jgi:hypothetical protein
MRAPGERARLAPPSASGPCFEDSSVFRSFFLAGFEGTTGTNKHGEWIDQVAATQHDRFAHEDYARLREVGIRAAREAVRWPLVDRGGRYDWSSVDPFVAAARAHEIDVIWDLFHFGYPADVDLFSDAFPRRFADYCFAAARHLSRDAAGPSWFTPVNEPSYLAWAGGEAGLFAPHRHSSRAPRSPAPTRFARRAPTRASSASTRSAASSRRPTARTCARPRAVSTSTSCSRAST